MLSCDRSAYDRDIGIHYTAMKAPSSERRSPQFQAARPLTFENVQVLAEGRRIRPLYCPAGLVHRWLIKRRSQDERENFDLAIWNESDVYREGYGSSPYTTVLYSEAHSLLP
jgi:hypothetical protein